MRWQERISALIVLVSILIAAGAWVTRVPNSPRPGRVGDTLTDPPGTPVFVVTDVRWEPGVPFINRGRWEVLRTEVPPPNTPAAAGPQRHSVQR